MKVKCCLILLVFLITLPVWAAEEAGMIKNVKGTTNIERGSQKITATTGMAVFTGDQIVTGAGGSFGITLRDNTLLSAGPNSRIVINNFAFNSTTHAGAVDASIRRGTLSVVSGKIAKQSPDAVKFRTPSAILAVRGTEFVIDVGKDAE